MSFSISDAAKEELVQFSKMELSAQEFIRISRGVKCGGPKFDLLVDTAIQPFDKVLEYEGFQLVINETDYKLLESVKLDFAADGFVFDGAADLSC